MAIWRFFLLVALVGFVGGSATPNWPQWRGPHLNGTSSTAKNLPLRWSPSENVAWRTELPGWSAATPIVWENTVFVTSAEQGFSQASQANDKMFLIAVNRKDGSIRWQREIGGGNEIYMKQNLATPSPVTDGKHVWTMTGSGFLTGFDFAGTQIWQRNIQQDFGKFGVKYGYASTPLLHGGKLYIQVLHGELTTDPSYVLAVEGGTGKTLWRVERPTDAYKESKDDYSTPILIAREGGLQLVISGGDYVTGHDLDSGHETWRMGGLNPERRRSYRTIASSITLDGMIFTTSMRGNPFIAFRAGGQGDVTKTNMVWQNAAGPDVPSPTTDGKRIYVLGDNGVMAAYDPKTGTPFWERQRVALGSYSASPVIADGKIYVTNEEGTTTVLAVGDEFKTLAVNKLEDHTLSTPALVDSQIFIRTDKYLYCIAER